MHAVKAVYILRPELKPVFKPTACFKTSQPILKWLTRFKTQGLADQVTKTCLNFLVMHRLSAKQSESGRYWLPTDYRYRWLQPNRYTS